MPRSLTSSAAVTLSAAVHLDPFHDFLDELSLENAVEVPRVFDFDHRPVLAHRP
jgi:hypothetical protein